MLTRGGAFATGFPGGSTTKRLIFLALVVLALPPVSLGAAQSAQDCLALKSAAASNKTQRIASLLSRSVDIECTVPEVLEPFGTTPLWHAAASGSVEAAELLIRHGANVNAHNEYGQTALSMARYFRHQNPARHDEAIRLLLRARATE